AGPWPRAQRAPEISRQRRKGVEPNALGTPAPVSARATRSGSHGRTWRFSHRTVVAANVGPGLAIAVMGRQGSALAVGPGVLERDSDQHPLLPAHALSVVVPVRVLVGKALIVVDQSVHRLRQR